MEWCVDIVYIMYILFHMSKTMISVKVDEDAKQKAQAVAKQMGLSLSALINSHLHQVARERRLVIDLDIRLEPQTETTTAVINDIEDELSKEQYEDFEDTDKLFSDLKGANSNGHPPQ